MLFYLLSQFLGKFYPLSPVSKSPREKLQPKTCQSRRVSVSACSARDCFELLSVRNFNTGRAEMPDRDPFSFSLELRIIFWYDSGYSPIGREICVFYREIYTFVPVDMFNIFDDRITSLYRGWSLLSNKGQLRDSMHKFERLFVAHREDFKFFKETYIEISSILVKSSIFVNRFRDSSRLFLSNAKFLRMVFGTHFRG